MLESISKSNRMLIRLRQHLWQIIAIPSKAAAGSTRPLPLAIDSGRDRFGVRDRCQAFQSQVCPPFAASMK